MKKRLLLLLTIFSLASFAQEVNKHISYVTIYDYLDELANIHVIEINSAIKPYSRKMIATKLKEAETKRDQLTQRQQKDLDFFLKDYNKEFIPNKKITRTFQMDNSPWDAQLEFMEFEKLTATTSKLTIHIVYRSADDRDGMLKRGMGKGLSMAHDRLQNIVEKIK